MKNKGILTLAAILVLVLAACGSQPGTQPRSVQVAKVVIEPGSVLLAKVGASQQLSAKAFDAQGNPVTANITWESSKPGNVGVDANGLATGVAVGSSQLTAQVGSLKSAPIIAATATLTSDTADIAADKIVAGPNFINLPAGQAPTVGSQYTAVVRNLSPTVGRKWFSQGQGGQRLQGRIVGVQDAEGGNKLVTLEVVPYQEIFSQLSIDEEVDFSQSTDVIPPGFKPQGVGSQAFVGINSVLECELSNVGATPPFTLGIPSMSISFNTDEARTGIRVNIGFGQDNTVLVRFKGSLNANLALNGRITHNFSGSVDCRSRNPITRNIVGIPLPLLTSLTSERGLGVKFSGDFSGPDTDFQASGSLAVAIDIGARLNLSSGSITRFNTLTPTANGLLRLTQANSITQFSTSAEAYVFDNWILNVPGVAFDLWVDKNGIRSVANMVSVPQQITSGTRTTYRLERFGRNGPGPEFDNFLRFFNAQELLPAAQSYTDPIRPAPFTLETFGCNNLNGSTTRALCITHFSERTFPVVGDNILKLEIWARRGNGTPFRVAEDTSVSTNIIVTTTSSDITLQAGDQCFLAVYTKTLPFAGIVAGNANSCL